MRPPGRTAPPGRALGWRSRQNLFRLAVLLAVAAFVTAGLLFSEQLTPARLGYSGIAVLALLASGAMVLPVPALAAVCSSSVLLNPLLLGLVAGSAETVGELTGYLLGVSGRDIASRGRWYPRIQRWMRQRGWLVLLVLSIVPNPVFDVAGVAAGAVRFPLPAFLAVIWVGKVVKFTGLSYACVYSIQWIIRVFV